MNFIEKKMSLDDRQTIDIILWFFILSLGATLVFLLYAGNYLLAIPVFIGFCFVVTLMLKNNKIALKEIKGKQTKKRETK